MFLLSLRVTRDRGIGLWEYHGPGQPLAASRKLRALWRFPQQEDTLDLATMMARVHPAARSDVATMIERAFAEGHAAIEFPIDRASDGQPPELAWLVGKATRIATVPPHLVGITYDITTRRIAEARIADLLRRSVAEREAERLQVAPTILRTLGASPRELQAVQIEGTSALPGVSKQQN